MMVSEKIYQTIASGTGSFNHGHTYMGHPVGCAAALAVQQVIKADNLLANVQSQGLVLENLLLERFRSHPRVGDIRGRGLLRAVEIVEDPRSKKPFAATLKLHARIKQQAMAEGLICYPGGGTADGESGDHILIAPPFNVTQPQLEQIVAKLASALDGALQTLPRKL
jgi:adenosylmethionine-8-amino-7-oxononanoate aminotransferase